MPPSLTVTVVLLFFLFYLPMVAYKSGLNAIIPLRQAEFHLSEEVIWIHLPVAALSILFCYLFSAIGIYLNVKVILVAMGNTALLNEQFFNLLKAEFSIYMLFEILLFVAAALLGLTVGRILRWHLRRSKEHYFLFGHILDPWFCLFLKAKNSQIMIDVLTRSNRLYSGELVKYDRSKDGELTGLLLKNVGKYKQLDPEDPETTSKPQIRNVPGQFFHFFVGDIANVNLRYIKAEEPGGTVTSYDFERGAKPPDVAKSEMVEGIEEEISSAKEGEEKPLPKSEE